MILRILHLTYYIIYNYYFENGKRKNNSPRLKALTIYTFVFCAQIGFVYFISKIIKDPYFYSSHEPVNKIYFYLVTVLAGTLSYLFFVKGGKSAEIYDHYKDKSWANTRFAKILGWLYILLSILSPFLLIIIRNAAIGRHLI